MNTPQLTSLPPLVIQGKTTYPIIQGGMGVGISNGNLAGTVAMEGGIGTLSSVGLAWIEKYRRIILNALIKERKAVGKLSKEDFNGLFNDATIIAARQEIQIAQEISGGKGALWLNTMVAINDYKRHVELACETGLDGIVSGAGLPLDLPTITQDYPNVALVPILSNLRGVTIVMKKWERLRRIPDAIVLEDPTRAGGHLGASGLKSLDEEDIKNSTLEVAVPEVRKFLETEGLGSSVPIIAAGGIVTHEDVKRVLELGASGAQLGTRFLASEESGANIDFMQAVLDAQEEEDIRIYTSNAMLPARALSRSGVFSRIDGIAKVTPCVENCLRECAFRDGVGSLKNGDNPAQMCILNELARSANEHGGENGLMFAGVSALRIHTLLSVHDIMRDLLGLER